MAVTQYIGARYVPLFYGEWVKNTTYEPLTVVEHEGNSYTSKQYVPKNIEITNTDFWASTGNYNAQVEYYRREVENMKIYVDNSIDAFSRSIDNVLDTITAINTGATFDILANGKVRVIF